MEDEAAASKSMENREESADEPVDMRHQKSESSSTTSAAAAAAAITTPVAAAPQQSPKVPPSPQTDNLAAAAAVAAAAVVSRSPNDDSELSPFVSQPYSIRRRNTLRRVKRVSRHAALTTKQVVWDSNDASIDAALSAVDQWEAAYNALRGLLVASFQSAQRVYGAAKEGAGKIEHGFLMPVRDWLLLPAFGGMERAVSESVRFLHSEQASHLAGHSLELAKQVPLVGENVLAPAMIFSVGFVQRSWEIAQYPIPSKQQVRDTVDFALTSTKWALSHSFREVYLYMKRADANITRSLSHTQWKVLGSGPYATLDKLSKGDVIDHLCERYFSLADAVARYELAAHIRAHNIPLYNDLVVTGILKTRGAELTEDDEWLLPCPVYRALENPFLLTSSDNKHQEFVLTDAPHAEISPLWFRLPYLNGKRPGNDVPWVCFRGKEQHDLEERYRQIIQNGGIVVQEGVDTTPKDDDEELPEQELPTIAQWYTPNPSTDVFVDQQRHAVSYDLVCPLCKNKIPLAKPPLAPAVLGDICVSCKNAGKERPDDISSFTLPSLTMTMRPTFWRFHGLGDEVRRGSWFLDTPRNGLQPFNETAQAVLEDAYLFLNWMSIRQAFDSSDTEDINNVLLTVEVPSPGDPGKNLLVQFSSLTHATAIQKGLGAAIAIFKRRVYRGAWLKTRDALSKKIPRRPVTIEETILQAVEDNGQLGDTIVPDVSIRSVLASPPSLKETSLVLFHGPDEITSSLAAPPERLYEKEDMTRYLEDHRDQEIGHLCLIVHGIGEMMRSIDVFGLSLPTLSSIVDCCGYLRKNHDEVHEVLHSKADAGFIESRVEYLPVEWHEAFSIFSQRRRPNKSSTRIGRQGLNVMLNDISLRTIGQMRDFVNDSLMDVLYFMSPEHHDVIVKLVANEMESVVQRFRRVTGFKGRVSLIGHSLGSIISWDILGNQHVSPESENGQVLSPIRKTESTESLEVLPTGYTSSDASELSMEPCVPDSPCPQLSFSVDNFFLLGSPVAVFLMIRNQRAPLSEDFYLRGCRRVFNVFHPYDPVAYRIEPCIDPHNADFEPTIIKHWNGGLRVQYQTKRLWRMIVDTTWKTQQNAIEAFEANIARIGLLDTSVHSSQDEDEASSSEVSSDEQGKRQVKTGKLNRGRRIDYMLQEREIESANEYVAALAAHSSYWIEKDFSLFVARHICRSNLEREAVEEWEAISY